MKLVNYIISNFKKNSLENFSSVFFIFKKMYQKIFYNQKNFSEKISRKNFQKNSLKKILKYFFKKISPKNFQKIGSEKF